MENKGHVLLVDGMALLFRGFFATAFRGNFMTNSKGVPRNGLFGFLNYFVNAMETFQPSHVICCWDMGSKTFRNEIFREYKANRDEPPLELVPQFDLAKQLIEAFDIPNIGVEGYEADDCIGTLAKQLHQQNHITILSGDQDLLQLVDQQIDVAIMRKGQGNYELFTHDNFYEKKGLTPQQIIDLKGLMGDSSDNYPGVKGIGEKTAMKLLKEHHSIDQLLESKASLTKGVQKKLDLYYEDLTISKKLAQICIDVPIQLSIEEAIFQSRVKPIATFLTKELEFHNPNRWLDRLALQA
ncbi:5'-3' exonuclease H3TH domain-containing protein [Gracilibacillus sp. YIM 98692]|uniref:5'-3' exonuclease n=1 Tax=Gracilibacillus sp. YIM 98692 TaxID=2663532 RepID=UPI0013D68A16|nr:5'-3' exonuclease H3TH domain-containing protein [Gracilibacillus sp. YIM 98692]